ncbi:MAG TPA: hypothetical protein DCW94_01365 [Porticoccaceae bacterium]|nr:hypothetical protein [Porticoccaceae bacterium]
MEHRIGSRLSSSLNAELYVADKTVGVFPVSNIGISGIGLENCHGELHADMYLQVIIKGSDSTMKVYSGLNALVIWCQDDRAGLMWAGLNNDFSAEPISVSRQAA